MDNDFKPPSTPSKPPTPKAVLPQPYYMKPVRRPSPALQQPPPAYQLSERTMMPAYLRDGETSPFQRSLKDIKSSSKTFRVSRATYYAAAV